MARKLILDVDTGIDDALAIAYALASPELELIGVTGTYGNVEVAQGVRNSLAILELFGRTDVPVYAGPQREGFEVMEISQFIHGVNGIGETELYDAARPRAALRRRLHGAIRAPLRRRPGHRAGGPADHRGRRR